jgi:hypothetical protein
MIIKYKKLLGESYSTHEIEISNEEILKVIKMVRAPEPGCSMDEALARQVLAEFDDGDISTIRDSGLLLHSGGGYISWRKDMLNNQAYLEGHFTAIQLEAIAWWMKHKKVCSK